MYQSDFRGLIALFVEADFLRAHVMHFWVDLVSEGDATTFEDLAGLVVTLSIDVVGYLLKLSWVLFD